MADSTTKLSSEVDKLSSILLSTLDENVFFAELGQFLAEHVPCDSLQIFKVADDASAELVVQDGRSITERHVLAKGEGPTGHVIRTKKPYFSNHTERDPLFSQEAASGVRSELIVPIAYEGILIATANFKTIKNYREFSRDDITFVLSIISGLKRPLANMKMYLSACHLNEALMKKITEQEKELEERKHGVVIANNFKISEKEIIGKSDIMEKLFKIADKVAGSEIHVLLQGEPGTGKEMIGRRIHCRSSRKEGPFVVVDCSALTERQLHGEIFGQEDGDLIHGHTFKTGALESSTGGGLFLSDIEALTPAIQAKLAQFLSEGLAIRLGGQVPYRSNVRILAATSKDLSSLVAEGKFREDLFYLLNTVTLNIPALRERKEDIELLANYFLNNARRPEEHKSMSPGVIKLLKEYSWPGNVRELQNIIERAYILSDGMIIEANHLSESITISEKEQEIDEKKDNPYTEMTLDELERKHIVRTLEHLAGNKTKTAKVLGITVKTLYNKLHSYGMIMPKEA